MKKSFHVFFLFVLFSLFAVNTAWAVAVCPVPLQEDGNGGCFVNMPETGTKNVNIPASVTSFKVYDDGGKDGNYSYNANGDLVLVAPEGYGLQVAGTVYSYCSGGLLSIYDGENSQANALLLDKFGYNGAVDITETVGGIIASSDNKLMLKFYSTYANSEYTNSVARGLNLTVTVFPSRSITVNAPAVGGTVVSDKSNAFFGTKVSLTASPAEGYLFSSAIIKDGSGKLLNVNVDVDFSIGKALFAMPDADVIVTPVFTNVFTAEKGLYTNMPKTGTKNVNIPENVTSFKVYDDGGKDGNYSWNANGNLVLDAPDGVTLQVAGTVYSYCDGGLLSIYDGENSQANVLLLNKYGYNAAKDIGGTIASSGNKLMLKFYSSYYTYDYTKEVAEAVNPGLDLTVTLIDNRTVKFTNAVNGFMTSDKLFAKENDVVTLTPNPADGYYLSSLVVKDAKGNIVSTTESSDGTFTFSMPSGSVTVTPTFSLIPKITIVQPSFGKVEVVSNKVQPGHNLDLQVTPDDGYCFSNTAENMVVTLDDDGSEIATKSDYRTNLRYFMMPDGDITVTVNDAAFSPAPRIYIESAPNGRIVSDKDYACQDEGYTLTAIPDEGYVLRQVELTDDDNNLIATVKQIKWYSNEIRFYSGPSENEHVTPVFENNLTAEDLASLTVPSSGITEYDLPLGIKSLIVKGHSNKDKDGSLVLRVPDGYLLQVDIVMTAGSIPYGGYNDYLTIYDGDATEYSDVSVISQLWQKTGKANGTVQSSGNAITVNFKTGGNTVAVQFELRVKLVEPSYGAVSIAKAGDGKFRATIDGTYTGTETLSIPEGIEVDAVDYNRELEEGIPATALLPVTLPEGTVVNADFYTLEKVEQVGDRWQATMTYIGDGKLPQPNTPYAVILHEGETKLEFDLKGEKATVQTGKIQNVCSLDNDCQLDENKQIKNDWYFTGTYAYKEWKAGDEEIGLAYAFAATDNPGGAAKGKFGRIVAGAFANPMRSYLRKRDADVKLVKPQQAAASSYVARYSINNLPETIDVEFVKNDEKGGRTVLLGRMNTVTGEFKMLRDFDLKGRKVNSANRARGAYYGKKVLKK